MPLRQWVFAATVTIMSNGQRDEVGELQLDDGPLAHPRGADRGADEALLGDRGVDHACDAELVLQPGGGAERATEVADVLAEEEDPLVVAQRVGQRRADSVQIRDLPHHGEPTAGVCEQRRGGSDADVHRVR